MLSDQATTHSILIVDDDPNFGEALAELLAAQGYAAAVVPCGQQALAYLRSYPLPNLILLDLRMPTMNGWALRLELAGEPGIGEIPVILLSAVSNLAAEAEALQAVDSFRKPVDFQRLLARIRQLIPHKSSDGS